MIDEWPAICLDYPTATRTTIASSRSEISFRNWYTGGCVREQMYMSPGTNTTSHVYASSYARQTDLSPRTAATESCGWTRYLRELRNKWPGTTFLAWQTKRGGREFRIPFLFPILTLFRGLLAGLAICESVCTYITPHTYKCIYSLQL